MFKCKTRISNEAVQLGLTKLPKYIEKNWYQLRHNIHYYNHGEVYQQNLNYLQLPRFQKQSQHASNLYVKTASEAASKGLGGFLSVLH